MRPGQDLIMAGLAGFKGTRRIAGLRPEQVEAHFPAMFLKALEAEENCRWDQERILKGLGDAISDWEPVGEGGVLAALWNLSGPQKGGIEFDLKKIPMKQVTVEICELFHLNPYRLLTGDALVAAADNGGQAVRCLTALGIPAAVIGEVRPGWARRMYHGSEEAGFLERPQPDEIEKLK